jgi:hypothetical protein
VLAGALGGVAAAAASSLIRPSTVGATDHSALIVGETNTATLNTTLNNTAGTGTTLTTFAAGTGVSISGNSNAGKGIQANTQTGTGVRALANGAGYGVYSTSSTGISVMGIAGTVNPPTPSATFGSVGVVGFRSDGTGVWASSTTGTALKATSGGQAASFSSSSTSAPSLVSASTGGAVGVVGLGGNFAPEAYPDGVGVLGDNPDAAGVGVWGRSSNGSALLGDSDTGYGLEAYGSVGVFGSGDYAGVIGDVDGSTGVQGWSGVVTAPDPGANVGIWAGAENGRTALKVQGVVKMNRSGRASIGSTKSSIKVTVPGGVSSTSLAFANLQTNRAGYYVQAVALGTADSSITIYLNKALTTATFVSWIVIG